MNYKLAKELKENNFPQTQHERDWLKSKDKGYIKYSDFVPYPTREELRKACDGIRQVLPVYGGEEGVELIEIPLIELEICGRDGLAQLWLIHNVEGYSVGGLQELKDK
jgi:hypothetical protein